MRAIHVAAAGMCVLELLPWCLSAAEPSAAKHGDILQQAFAHAQERTAITQEQREATGAVSAELRALRRRVRDLQQPPPDRETVARKQRQLQRLAARLAQLRAELQDAQLTDADRRKAKAAELKAKADKLHAREQELAKPFRERLKGLEQDADETDAAFTAAMKAHFEAVDGQSTTVTGDFDKALATCTWQNDAGKQVAWAHVYLRRRPAHFPQQAKPVAGKYPVMLLTDREIIVWAGSFQVDFAVVNQDLQDRDKLKETITKYIDLPALAAVQVEE